MSARPADADEKAWHDTTWMVMGVMHSLLEAEGGLMASDLATTLETSLDTMRRVLRTLAHRGWVRTVPMGGRDAWVIGPELPRIGVQFQELLLRQQRALRGDFDRLSVPPGGA